MNGNNRRLYSYSECKKIDHFSQESGMPAVQLMGQAALASLYSLEKYLCASPRVIKRIFILCGSGNNGGDGLALAYHLLSRKGFFDPVPDTAVYCTSDKVKTSAARFYKEQLGKLHFPIREAKDFLNESFSAGDLIIEALLGIAQVSLPRGMILNMLLHVSKARSVSDSSFVPRLISLDIPAGLLEKAGPSFLPVGLPIEEGSLSLSAPDEIHCYGTDKISLRLSPSLCAYSQIRLLPIGLHPDFLPAAEKKVSIFPFHEFNKERVSYLSRVFSRKPTDHKYNAGHGLLIGGSAGMEGAVLMAARSFFAAGGGILHALVPKQESRQALLQSMPSTMFHTAETLPNSIRPNCILIGPGLKKEDLAKMQMDIQDLVKNNSAAYFILDASAVSLVFSLELPWERTVLLPHTGEWKALGGPAICDTESLYAALSFCQEKKIRCSVLVKDSICVFLSLGKTIDSERKTIDSEQAEAVLFSQPNGALSTAGSGDNLAGIALALLSKKEKYKSQKLEKNQGNRFMQEKILISLELLHRAALGRTHPRSDEWAASIEAILQSA